MKKNLPITNNEVPLKSSTVITSTTDLKGAVSYVNKDFLDISGYSTDELIGKNHNIVRHPDMPPAAFADLWATIKTGKPWMGLVKNRCKSGDYYWVDAFVTPLTKNGKITGYESTRVKMDEAGKERAGKLYQKIWSGKKLKLTAFSSLSKLLIAGALFQLILFSTLFFTGYLPLLVAIIAWLSGTGVSSFISFFVLKDLNQVLKEARAVVDNKVMQLAYTGKINDVSQISLAFRMLKAKLRTVVKRLEQATEQLGDQAQASADIVSETNISISQQQQEIEMVATAVNEMSATVQEVSQSTSNTRCRKDVSTGCTYDYRCNRHH